VEYYNIIFSKKTEILTILCKTQEQIVPYQPVVLFSKNSLAALLNKFSDILTGDIPNIFGLDITMLKNHIMTFWHTNLLTF